MKAGKDGKVTFVREIGKLEMKKTLFSSDREVTTEHGL